MKLSLSVTTSCSDMQQQRRHRSHLSESSHVLAAGLDQSEVKHRRIVTHRSATRRCSRTNRDAQQVSKTPARTATCYQTPVRSRQEPTDPQEYHYMNLRKIAELTESVPQVLLQAYIWVRLQNPWDPRRWGGRGDLEQVSLQFHIGLRACIAWSSLEASKANVGRGHARGPR